MPDLHLIFQILVDKAHFFGHIIISNLPQGISAFSGFNYLWGHDLQALLPWMINPGRIQVLYFM